MSTNWNMTPGWTNDAANDTRLRYAKFCETIKARRTHSRLCLLTTQLNRREQIRSRLVGVHCHDRAIQTWRFI